ncbi:MAG: LysR family transcriptional regulator [Alcaligenaceae bacterium]|nr:MAG: LysR family transcriptional regulator [Alcaligenaceae bacterium]
MNKTSVEAMWTHLYWLTVLDHQRSFTKAAARLGVSKAAVSQKLVELENATGVQLVVRTTRSVRLTEAGLRLASAAREPFERIAGSFCAEQEHAAAPRGLIRVTAPVALSRQRLGPVLVRFAKLFPNVRVELDLSDEVRSLHSEGFDLAIRHTTAAPETHVAWRLTNTNAVLVASRGYLRKHGTPATPQDLQQHCCLHYPRVHGAATWSFITPSRTGSREDIVTVSVSGTLAINNSEMLRDAAASGLGIALLPDFSAQSALHTGQLVAVLQEFQSTGAFGEWLYAIRPHSSHVPAAVRAFVEVLRRSFGVGFGS